MDENTKPDSGGAAFIAKRYVESLRETLDEHRNDINQMRDNTIPGLRADLTNLRIAFANLQGRLAIVAIVASIVVSALVTLLGKLVR